jgi:hypothetical protein
MLRDMESYLRKRGYSVRRFAWFLVFSGLAGAALGLVGVVTNWSHSVSFVTSVAIGTAISMAALRANPREWLRRAWEEWRAGRHSR